MKSIYVYGCVALDIKQMDFLLSHFKLNIYKKIQVY